jgi:hypothetical protein
MGWQKGFTGYVSWPQLPSDEWHITGENGMWVAAHWPCDYSHAAFATANGEPDDRGVVLSYPVDRFVRCHGPQTTIALPLPDAPVSATSAVMYPLEYRDMRDPYDCGIQVLASLILGTCAEAYADPNGEYFDAALSDLTEEGRCVVSMLNMLYERDAVLVTYLDT